MPIEVLTVRPGRHPLRFHRQRPLLRRPGFFLELLTLLLPAGAVAPFAVVGVASKKHIRGLSIMIRALLHSFRPRGGRRATFYFFEM